MKRLLIVPLLALPLAAAAQTYYREVPVYRGEVRSCADRDLYLRDQLSTLEQEKRDNDRNWDALEREGSRLERERQRLDNANVAAVNDYNARSDEHNRRVAEHNSRVRDMNQRASMHNGDAADFSRYCSGRSYFFRDYEVIRRDYSPLR